MLWETLTIDVVLDVSLAEHRPLAAAPTGVTHTPCGASEQGYGCVAACARPCQHNDAQQISCRTIATAAGVQLMTAPRARQVPALPGALLKPTAACSAKLLVTRALSLGLGACPAHLGAGCLLWGQSRSTETSMRCQQPVNTGHTVNNNPGCVSCLRTAIKVGPVCAGPSNASFAFAQRPSLGPPPPPPAPAPNTHLLQLFRCHVLHQPARPQQCHQVAGGLLLRAAGCSHWCCGCVCGSRRCCCYLQRLVVQLPAAGTLG